MSANIVNIVEERKRELTKTYGREVDTVIDYDDGVMTSIFMRKSDFVFTAVVGDETFHDRDGDKVRAWAKKALKGFTKLEWHPVIVVLDLIEEEQGSHNYCGRDLELHTISVDISRCYVAQRPNGQVKMVGWDDDRKVAPKFGRWKWIEKDNKDIPISALPASKEGTHLLPYTAEMWKALTALVGGIDELSKKLRGLLESPGGRKRLLEIGQRMQLMLGDGKS